MTMFIKSSIFVSINGGALNEVNEVNERFK